MGLPSQQPALNPGTPMPAPPPGMAGALMQQLNPAAGMLGGQGPFGAMAADATAGDPVMAQMLASPPAVIPFDPLAGVPDTEKPGYMPPLDAGIWRELANKDQERYRRLTARFSRDLAMYRQRISAKPPTFDPKRELAFRSATFSNIVNKLTNMCSPLDFRFVVPFKDEQSKQNSQILENWYGYLRTCAEIEYATAGGASSLAWDEFFYLFLYGRIVRRVLPNRTNLEHPFFDELVDPSTVFPVWGGSSEGLIRITHRRPMSFIDVVSTYAPYSPNLYERMQSTMVKDFDLTDDEPQRSFHIERELTEGWDTWNQWADWGGIEVYNKPHALGVVPWIYTMARGEPRGMTTPEGKYWVPNWENPDDPDAWLAVDAAVDEAEKGVSVFHHLIHTNRLTEVVYTILTTEVLKARNPPTVTYSAQQMEGQASKPLIFTPGGNNQRTLNAQRVEIVPTSPRPTDTSPLLGKLTGDITEGSINPAMFGAVEGSNIAGFAIESMIAASKDTVLPYLKGFEIHNQSVAQLKTIIYEKVILPIGIMSTPMEGRYGSSPSADVTADVIRSVGRKVTCEIIGVSDQQLPALVNAAGAATERGFWSRRKAMERLGEKDPSRMLREIILERALEHPEMMENFLIPIEFIRSGQKDLADLWVLMIVMPKIQMLMMQMLGPQAGGAAAGVNASGATPGDPMQALAALGGGGGQGPAMIGPGTSQGAPQQNGQSNPIAMRARGAPTGPQFGQGRGPAPQQQAA